MTGKEDSYPKYEQKEITSKVKDVITGRTSSNGTPYAVVILEAFPDEWFFVWEGDFKDDIENFPETYKGSQLKVLYKDKEDEPGEHFFNVDKLWPTKPEKCRKLLQLKKSMQTA